jgi:hypothetical protein
MHLVHTAAAIAAIAVPALSIVPGAAMRWRIGWVALCAFVAAAALADEAVAAPVDVVGGAHALGWPAVTAALGWRLVDELGRWREILARALDDLRRGELPVKVQHSGPLAEVIRDHGEVVREHRDVIRDNVARSTAPTQPPPEDRDDKPAKPTRRAAS